MKSNVLKKFGASALIVSLMVSMSGCAGGATKQDVGTVAGGVLGGVLGSQVGGGQGRTAAIIAGSLAGAFLGSAIGKSMDDTDRMKTSQAMESNPTGRASSWRNPDTGSSYTVTPTRTYESAEGPCRDFTSEGVIDGRRELVKGKACRQADGSWKMM